MRAIYIAGQYARRDEFRAYAASLRLRGIVVTSRWLDEPYPLNSTITDLTPEENHGLAMKDRDDIEDALGFLFFAEDPGNQPPRGGRHVEFGYAVAFQKRIFVIGGPENTFHYLPEIKHYPTFEEFLRDGTNYN